MQRVWRRWQEEEEKDIIYEDTNIRVGEKVFGVKNRLRESYLDNYLELIL